MKWISLSLSRARASSHWGTPRLGLRRSCLSDVAAVGAASSDEENDDGGGGGGGDEVSGRWRADDDGPAAVRLTGAEIGAKLDEAL